MPGCGLCGDYGLESLEEFSSRVRLFVRVLSCSLSLYSSRSRSIHPSHLTSSLASFVLFFLLPLRSVPPRLFSF